MKETPIFEEVFMRLLGQRGAVLKILVGGLFSFIPGVNLLAFGYLYRFSAQLRRSGQLTLPDWADWPGLLLDGIKCAVAWLAYCLLPLAVAFLFSALLSALGLAPIGYLLIAVVFAASAVLFSAALYRLQGRSEFRDLLDVVLICRMAYLEWPRFVLPALVFLGIVALGLPLYGLAMFTAFLTLISFTTIRYRLIEQHQTASV